MKKNTTQKAKAQAFERGITTVLEQLTKKPPQEVTLPEDLFLPDDIGAIFDELMKPGQEKSEIIKKANIDRTYGYQLMNGTRKGKRDYYILLALAMGLDAQMTDRILAAAGYGALHAHFKRDFAIIKSLNNGYSVAETYHILQNRNMCAKMEKDTTQEAKAQVFKRGITTELEQLTKKSPQEAPLPEDLFLPDNIGAIFDELMKPGQKKSEIIKKANLDPTYGYQLMNGTRKGNRDYYILLALAMGLDAQMTDRILAAAGYGALHAHFMRDFAIIKSLNKGYSVDETYHFMCRVGVEPLDDGANR